MHSLSCRCKLHPSANQAGTGIVLKSGPKIPVMADLFCGGKGAASLNIVTTLICCNERKYKDSKLYILYLLCCAQNFCDEDIFIDSLLIG